jgi:hypothetical protein
MHFLAHVRLEWRTLTHVENSMNGPPLGSPGGWKRLIGVDLGSCGRDRESKRNYKKPGCDCVECMLKVWREGQENVVCGCRAWIVFHPELRKSLRDWLVI